MRVQGLSSIEYGDFSTFCKMLPTFISWHGQCGLFEFDCYFPVTIEALLAYQKESFVSARFIQFNRSFCVFPPKNHC